MEKKRRRFDEAELEGFYYIGFEDEGRGHKPRDAGGL